MVSGLPLRSPTLTTIMLPRQAIAIPSPYPHRGSSSLLLPKCNKMSGIRGTSPRRRGSCRTTSRWSMSSSRSGIAAFPALRRTRWSRHGWAKGEKCRVYKYVFESSREAYKYTSTGLLNEYPVDYEGMLSMNRTPGLPLSPPGSTSTAAGIFQGLNTRFPFSSGLARPRSPPFSPHFPLVSLAPWVMYPANCF